MPATKPIRNLVKPGFYLSCVAGFVILFLFMLAAAMPDKPPAMTQFEQLQERQIAAERHHRETLQALTTRLEASERARLELVDKVSELEKTAKIRTSVERFDPTTGKLTERVTSKISTTEKRKDADKTRTSEVNTTRVETKKDVTKKTETATQSTEATKTQTTAVFENKRSGVGVGLLVMGTGVGPAASINVARLGPAGVDVTLGAVGLPGKVSPRLGALLTVEPVPHLTVGVGPFLSVPGDPLGYAPPGSPVGVAPGVTLQYRF